MEGGGSQVFTTVFTQMQNERAIAAIFGLEESAARQRIMDMLGVFPSGDRVDWRKSRYQRCRQRSRSRRDVDIAQ
jgi:hypothetical protein